MYPNFDHDRRVMSRALKFEECNFCLNSLKNSSYHEQINLLNSEKVYKNKNMIVGEHGLWFGVQRCSDRLTLINRKDHVIIGLILTKQKTGDDEEKERIA